ncbi:hypothetical protein MN116_002819 [Schistosoma mekongi]|uniref:Uncharacterized protein n=1 Tax=Schistosoma mekongi TaxID=38744 RepID=A0AAE1ZFU1_SCHME|nr:hypothetical protein MN116_002819 [Schistosoma mekongi]
MIETGDDVDLKNYKRLKNTYKLFCVGFVVFLTGFLFIFFGRPYTFDRTNKDLFFVFGLVFIFPGLFMALLAAYLLFRLWKSSNDFTKLNKMPVYPEDTIDDLAPLEKPWVTPTENSPNFSKFGLDLNEPI